MTIDEACDADLETVRRLFRAYADSLPFSLDFQNFAAELAALPAPYTPPAGCLLLARRDGAAIGAVALKPLAAGIAEIKRLYYQTSRHTIGQDFARAIDLVKSMTSEEERERVAVYMDGLSQMRSEWGGPPRSTSPSTSRTRSGRRPGQ